MILTAFIAVAAGRAEDRPVTPNQAAFFEARIRPVLVGKCYACHSAGAEKVGGNLLLDTREGARRGGVNGPAVVPGDLMASLLISALRWHDVERGMPPQNKGGKLPASVIASFEQWVLMGAPDPRATPVNPVVTIPTSNPRQGQPSPPGGAPVVPRLPVTPPRSLRDLRSR